MIGLGKKLPTTKLELNTNLGQQEYGVATHFQDRPDIALALSKATFEDVLSTHVNKSRNKLVLFNDRLPDWDDSDIIAGAQV